MSRRIRDLTGQRFGRLTAICRDMKAINWDTHAVWKCKCDCGNEVSVLSHNLLTGITKSCGCLRAEITTAMGKRNKKVS